MFESVVLRRPIFGDKKLDVGLLAETLLFYQNVHLILDHGSLISIVKTIGAENLLWLIENEHIKASFMKQGMGTITSRQGGLPVHNFGVFEVGSKQKKRYSKEEAILLALETASLPMRDARQYAKKLGKRIPTEKLEVDSNKSLDIVGMAREDLLDARYVNTAIRLILHELAPVLEIPPSWEFRVHEASNGFAVLTNFDFNEINSAYHRIVSPSESTISPEFLLNHILDARADIAFSAKHMAELVTTPMSSKSLELKFSMMLEKRSRNTSDIDLFQQIHLEGNAVRKVINSKERSFSEFLELLERAQKFKSWLKSTHPEVGLIKEYYASATANTWIEKLPMKTMRFSVFSGLGVLADAMFPTGLGTVAGIGAGAADTFIMDKLLKGWRPSQFVEEKLSNFVRVESDEI